MLVIENQKHFDEVVTFAKKVGLYEDAGDQNQKLANRLAYLEKYGGKRDGGADRTRVRLFPDSAPYSFYFVIEKKKNEHEWERMFDGGLLFHGSHDGHGSGDAPTFAVTLDHFTGWSIHT